MKVLIVGSGYMASEYAKVLTKLNIDFSIIGRSEKSCELLKVNYTHCDIFSGGVENFNRLSDYSHAIISSNVEYLLEHSILCLENRIKNILVEKPGGKNLVEIEKLFLATKKFNANVFIAYNRRFYSSIDKLKFLLSKDTPILSFNFEFTEWPHTLEGLKNQEVVKENLLYANSTHLIDLAFHLNGKPKSFYSISMDRIEWHRKAIYAGIGFSTNGAVFNYQANWKGPGRWGIEIITNNFRYYLRPLEELWIQKTKSVKLEKIELNNVLDIEFKPGLFNQVQSFLFKQEDDRLLRINEQFENCRDIYEQILNGNFPDESC